MKLFYTIFFLIAAAFLVNSLHFSSHKLRKDSFSMEKSHQISYHGRHYRSHRTAEYIEKVKEENLKFIDHFNQENKQKLKSVSEENHTVKGGHAFAMAPNIYKDFTGQEFVHSFTGQILTQEDQDHINKMQEHYREDMEHEKKSNWTFEDPYAINDQQIEQLYGEVNSDDNYGRGCSNSNPNHITGHHDEDDFWKTWQKNHWEDDSQDQWWKSFYYLEQENQDNDDWWNDFFGDDDYNPSYDNYDDNNNNNNYGYDDGNDQPNPTPKPSPTPTPSSNGRKIPEFEKNAVEVNWVHVKATTHIKHQGECGSCWTFGVIGIVESYQMIMGKEAMDLSEQQLLDCQTKSSGCNGGIRAYALDWVAANGVVLEEKYPYRGRQQRCLHSSGTYKIPKSSKLSGRQAIEAALRKGPVSAGVHVDDYDYFQFYSKGIFDKCVSTSLNHAIILVGYTKDYWIIRNSWGAEWGENGHMRLKKNQNNGNACGIQSNAFGMNF